MLELESVHKALGATPALKDCNLRAQVGERLVIHGPNGAGKSTLLQVVAGVLAPDRGSVRWRAQSLSSGASKVRQKIGYVPEAADPPGHLSVAELLHFIASVKGCEPVSRELVETLAIEDLLAARIDELSLGQRRRACLAAALTGDPELLLLDEPTNGLDAAAIEVLAELLCASEERTVVIATHDAHFAERVATRRVELRAGAIVETETQK